VARFDSTRLADCIIGRGLRFAQIVEKEVSMQENVGKMPSLFNGNAMRPVLWPAIWPWHSLDAAHFESQVHNSLISCSKCRHSLK
jgi:hypothetical protein